MKGNKNKFNKGDLVIVEHDCYGDDGVTGVITDIDEYETASGILMRHYDVLRSRKSPYQRGETTTHGPNELKLLARA